MIGVELLKLELEGAEELMDRLENLTQIQKDIRMREAWESILELLRIDAAYEAPKWQYRLAEEFGEEIEITDTEIKGIVYSSEEYAPFQERGLKPVYPNIDNILPWAEDHDINVFYLAKLIAERGIDPIKFFEKAILENEDVIVEVIGSVVVQIIEYRAY